MVSRTGRTCPRERCLCPSRRIDASATNGAVYHQVGFRLPAVSRVLVLIRPMIETSDCDILATALLTIKRHGESAAYYAASRADQLEEQGAYTAL